MFSAGYDSSELHETAEICRYISMGAEDTDFYYAVVSNESDSAVTVEYKTELELPTRD